MRVPTALGLANAIELILGGGGAGGGSSSNTSLLLTADFADVTRPVPGYADILTIEFTAPAGVNLPAAGTL